MRPLYVHSLTEAPIFNGIHLSPNEFEVIKKFISMPISRFSKIGFDSYEIEIIRRMHEDMYTKIPDKT